MIQFKLSAPNKLSLFGEHVVNYGKIGLQAAINLRTTLTFTELSHLGSKDFIQFNFLQLSLLFNISLQQFIEFYRNCIFDENNDVLHDEVLRFITFNYSAFRTEHQRTIVQTFIYLLVYISHKERIHLKPFSVNLSTELMIDTDSVCLASIVVCLVACLLRWSNMQKGAIDDFDSNDLDKIYSYATRCEKISYESAAAVAACTYGSIIQHQIGKTMQRIPFFEMLNVTILLIDSKQNQNLQAQTQHVTNLMNTYPEVIYCIFNTMNIATSIASNALRKFYPTFTNNEFGLETKRLILMTQHNLIVIAINMTQKLLHLLNVSHLHLDKIHSIAVSHETYAKYTDIGNGRYAYIWCLPNASIRRILNLSAELKTNNFDVTKTTVACQGVKVEY